MRQVHLRLPDDRVDMIDTAIEGKSINEKVTNFICSNYITSEFLELEKRKCEAKLETINRYLEKNPFSNLDVLSGKEKEFFDETLRIMSKDPSKRNNPEFIRGRKNIYVNTFPKQITFKEFELLVYKFKESKEK